MSDQLLHRFPVEVEVRASDEKLLKELRKRVGDDVVDNGTPYFWRAIISNSRLDSYFTTMSVGTLKNYAKDAAQGVPFQDSHKSDSIARTLGRSLTGEYIPLDENDVAQVQADFYTFRGIDPLIDSFITKVETGISRSVSVGFLPGEYTCSICKRDMLSDWDCWHVPGWTYPVGDSRDKDAEKVLCTATVQNGRLVEVSSVYSGSTPGAVILKAERMAEAGKLPHHMAQRIEERYGVRILGSKQVYLPAYVEDRSMSGAPLGQGTEKAPDTTPEPQPQIDVTAEVERQVAERMAKIEGEHAETHRGLSELLMSRNLVKEGGLVESVRALIAERDSLVKPAEEGKQYRIDLIDEALNEGVRAFGNEFKRDTYKRMLENSDLDFIKQMKSDWSIIAARVLQGGAHIGSGANGAAPEDKDPSRYKA